MKKIRLLAFIFLATIFPAHACFAQYDTLDRKQTLIFDIGMGSMFLYEELNQESYNPTATLYSFNPSVNFQTTLGYALKLDRMSFEWKVGYNHAEYYINFKDPVVGKASFTTSTHTGSAILNTGFIQLLGVNFGKERSWGSLCFGANIRYNFIADSKTTGASIVKGSKWNGSVMIGVYEENPLEPPIYFSSGTLGVQAGANIRINELSEIQARFEYNMNVNELMGYNAFQGLFCVGYVHVLKRDRAILRK